MNLLDYIKGNRKGKDAHRIEKESMQDPFMYEAIEGFDSVRDDHSAAIEAIQKRIQASSSAQKQSSAKILKQVAAACIIGTIMLGGFFLIDGNRSDIYAQERDNMGIINIYVPEQYYSENIATIAQSNTELVKAYQPMIRKFTLEELNIPSASEDNFELLAKNEIPINIYLPEEEKQSASKKEVIAQQTTNKNYRQKTEVKQADIAADRSAAPTSELLDVAHDYRIDDELADAISGTYADAERKNTQEEVVVVIPLGMASAKKASRKAVIPSAADALILESIPIIGMDEYKVYLAQSTKYPTTGDCQKVKGSVVLEFSVKEDGTPYDIQVVTSLCTELDLEAIRLLKEGSKWHAYRQPARLRINF